MTRDEARRRAVEAAREAERTAIPGGSAFDAVKLIADTYERAMADAGWRMVRDCGDSEPQAGEQKLEWDAGWNACRAKMLGED